MSVFKCLGLIGCLIAPGCLPAQSVNTPELMGESVNTEFNEIGPVISPDGKTLFFSRISHPQNAHGEKGSQDIWFSEFRNNRWAKAVRMPNVVNKDVYNAIYSITPDGNTILLKGSYQRGVYQTRGFSISKRVRRTWSAPETLEIPDYEKLSKGEFDCAFMTNDGQALIISFSEKKKGRNDDLYVSFKGKDGKWSKPQSLGSDINTSSHMETTPFMAADGLTLYFSSDRPGGQGGNDIYSSRRLDGTWKRWSKPVNLGPSVNTEGFEGYYSVAAAGDYAYWSSNRKGSDKKGEIYRLSLQKPPAIDSLKKDPDMEIIAEVPDLTLPDPVAMISGKVLNSKTGQPVEATVVFQSFPDGKEMGMATTDPLTGEYKFTLPYGQIYTMRPLIQDFIAETEMIDLTDKGLTGNREQNDLIANAPDSTPSADGVESVVKPDTAHIRSYREFDRTVKVVPLEVGEVVRLNNIFFETAKSSLQPESKMELDQMVRVMKEYPTIKVELGGHTDSEGSDASNLKLSQDRSNTVRAYLLEQGVAGARVTAVGYGETVPVASNDTEEGRQANRRVEFRILEK